MPTLEELNQQFEGRVAPVEDPAEPPIAWGEGTPTSEAPDAAPVAEALPLAPESSETHPILQQVWDALSREGWDLAKAGREAERRFRASGGKMNAQALTLQIQRLKAIALAAPTLAGAVTEAEAVIRSAEAEVVALQARHAEAEAEQARLDGELATLQRRASRGDPEAAALIPAAEQALWLTHRRLSVQLPAALDQAKREVQSAQAAHRAALVTRDRADYNNLCAQDAPLDQGVMDATGALLDALDQRLAHHLAKRSIAGRLGMAYGEAHQAPEDRLRAYVLGQLEARVPHFPYAAGRRLPEVSDLVGDAAHEPALSDDEFAARVGSGRVWVRYRGTLNTLDWSGCERPARDRQEAFKAHHALDLPMRTYEILRERYGDMIEIAPWPAWSNYP